MKIVVARSAGFCMGVRRAIHIAHTVAEEEGRTVYTYGPLIHNARELAELRKRGVEVMGEDDPIPAAPVIVRAHGVTPEAYGRIEAGAGRLVDATCPKVAKIHEQLREYTARGYDVIIAGDPDHPEVVGLLGHAGNRAHVISTPEEVDGLGPLDPVLLVAQTTQDEENYARIRERFHARYPGGEALDTICTSTRRRQAELRRLVGEVEGVVVVGGRNSANTRRLFEISREAGVDAWLVESAAELPLEALKNRASLAVTAGASTPRWIIEEVVNRLAAL